ncbi:chromate transporter [Vibrio parahaemolyticus]|nr:chromate transporter [Vibrio parahaemolyticus]
MQLYIDIFFAFFIPNIVGYGGGPAIIPLIEAQVVGQYGWMNASQFAEVLALGNALPSPIATKMAGYIGYEVGGTIGACIAVVRDGCTYHYHHGAGDEYTVQIP